MLSGFSPESPFFFPEDVTHPADMLTRMVDAAQSLQPIYENPYDANMSDAIELTANGILDMIS